MKKMYYKCPIEAAYMARNFGVNFLFDPEPKDNAVFLYWNRNALVNTLQINRFYIHPDSLSIFEPQVNDMNNEGYFFTGNSEYCDGVWYKKQYNESTMFSSSKNIIQRNNKPFIVPEVEE